MYSNVWIIYMQIEINMRNVVLAYNFSRDA